MNNDDFYYVAVGTDGRIISTSRIGEDYYEWYRALRDDLKWSETHIGIAKIEKIAVPSQS